MGEQEGVWWDGGRCQNDLLISLLQAIFYSLRGEVEFMIMTAIRMMKRLDHHYRNHHHYLGVRSFFYRYDESLI